MLMRGPVRGVAHGGTKGKCRGDFEGKVSGRLRREKEAGECVWRGQEEGKGGDRMRVEGLRGAEAREDR